MIKKNISRNNIQSFLREKDGKSVVSLILIVILLFISSAYFTKRYWSFFSDDSFKNFFKKKHLRMRQVSIIERDLTKSSIMGKGLLACKDFVGQKITERTISLSRLGSKISFAYSSYSELVAISSGQEIKVRNTKRFSIGDLVVIESLYNSLNLGIFQVYEIDSKNGFLKIEALDSIPVDFTCKITGESKTIIDIMNNSYNSTRKDLIYKISLIKVVSYTVRTDEDNRYLSRSVWPILGKVSEKVFIKNIIGLKFHGKFIGEDDSSKIADEFIFEANVKIKYKSRGNKIGIMRANGEYHFFHLNISQKTEEYSRERETTPEANCIQHIRGRDSEFQGYKSCIFDDNEKDCQDLYEIEITALNLEEKLRINLVFKHGNETILCAMKNEKKYGERYIELESVNHTGSVFTKLTESNFSSNEKYIFVCNIPDLSYRVETQIEYFSIKYNRFIKKSCGEDSIVRKGTFNWIEKPKCSKGGKIVIGTIGDNVTDSTAPILRLGAKSCLWSENDDFSRCDKKDEEREKYEKQLLKVRFVPKNIRITAKDKEKMLKDFVLICK